VRVADARRAGAPPRGRARALSGATEAEVPKACILIGWMEVSHKGEEGRVRRA
jgi:hypothetical protein